MLTVWRFWPVTSSDGSSPIHHVSRSPLSDQGSAAYQVFNCATVLKQVMHQSGQDSDQVLFRGILLRLRDARLTISDWEQLMKQTPAEMTDLAPFTNALHLHPTIEAVVEHNVARLRESGHQIATIKAVHSGPNAPKASSEDAGGLESMICLACHAHVMFTSNLWVDMGLVNGAMGTVMAICYHNGESPPNLAIAITVKFDSYRGPTLSDMMELFPSLHSAACGRHLIEHVHVSNSHSNWPGPSQFTRLKASFWTKW